MGSSGRSKIFSDKNILCRREQKTLERVNVLINNLILIGKNTKSWEF